MIIYWRAGKYKLFKFESLGSPIGWIVGQGGIVVEPGIHDYKISEVGDRFISLIGTKLITDVGNKFITEN